MFTYTPTIFIFTSQREISADVMVPMIHFSTYLPIVLNHKGATIVLLFNISFSFLRSNRSTVKLNCIGFIISNACHNVVKKII